VVPWPGHVDVIITIVIYSGVGLSKIFELVKLFELDSLKAWLMLGSKPKQAELKPQKQLASFFAQVRAV
jgi:hypothetical protein